MRILLDTNIFIGREKEQIIKDNLAALMRKISSAGLTALLHPISTDEVEKIRDPIIRARVVSRLSAYPFLESYSDPYNDRDNVFLEKICGNGNERKDYNDNIILYAVYKHAVSILVTEDKKLQRKALKFEPALHVYSIDDALEYLNEVYREVQWVCAPLGIMKKPMSDIDLDDHLFDSLKEEYGQIEFTEWFERKSEEGGDCYITYKPSTQYLGSFMALKIEEEAVGCEPPLISKRRLKITTLKVEDKRRKIGEALVSIAIRYAKKNNIDEVYLTHFTNPEFDSLSILISKFGFYLHGHDSISYPGKVENVYVKMLKSRDTIDEENITPLEANLKYYPSFYCGDKVNKFIIPIQPKFHDRLFLTSRERQTTLQEHDGSHLTEGYAILKAYLSNSRSMKLSKGDIIVFYKSVEGVLSTVGVVDEVYYNQIDTDEIMKNIWDRTVYSYDEVKDMKKPLLIILFKYNCDIERNFTLRMLRDNEIVSSAPQSITQISNESFMKIIKIGGIDENFIIY